MKVEIGSALFDRIERFLESKLPDGEAAAILQELEDVEIERTAREEIDPSVVGSWTRHESTETDLRS